MIVKTWEYNVINHFLNSHDNSSRSIAETYGLRQFQVDEILTKYLKNKKEYEKAIRTYLELRSFNRFICGGRISQTSREEKETPGYV